MANFPRYAIYYVPAADSDLYRFGAEVVGYDGFRGTDVSFPGEIIAAMPDWAELTRDPRKYGFHATLKAPFPMAAGKQEADLVATCQAFADKARTLPVIAPVIRAISGFAALVPSEPSDALSALAQNCVETFDEFRAPMTLEDRARRNPAALTPRQVEQLDRFGYPYVRDDFRFHMTLTTRLPPDRSEAILGLLRIRFSRLALATLSVDAIALFRQDDSTSRFHVVRRFVLKPT